jgi:hypothetical protein
MIAIGNDKLYSESEILANVRAYVKKHKITDIDEGGFAFEIVILAVALDEPEDFIRGAIRQ